MKTRTFSRETKNILCALNVRQECCRRALLAGLLLYRTPQDHALIMTLTERLESEFFREISGTADSVLHIEELMRCENCCRAFVRGIFLSCGTMTDPEYSYQLELAIPDRDGAEDIRELLESAGIPPKLTVRRGQPVLYYKESASIEDFLNYIGAQKAAFDLMNIKIMRDLRNNANRHTNCDAANITKTVGAAQQQVESIRRLRDSGQLDALSDELQYTARLRLENEDVNLAELARLHTPPVSKSGVNHRLRRLIALANTLPSASEKGDDNAP